jgi:hypothetical protein
MLDCLIQLENLGGFGLLAHVDADGGLEQLAPGAAQHKIDILCHRALLGLELRLASSVISYAESGEEAH